MSAAQAGSCLERFGDFDSVPAPALPPLEDVLASSAVKPEHNISSGSAHAAVAAAGSSAGHLSAQRTSAASLSRAGSADRVVSEAMCLATPPDNPAETNRPLRQPEPSTARLTANRGSISSAPGYGFRLNPARPSAVVQEVEELLQFEGAAVTYQYTCSRAAQALHANEVLRASAAVRRRNRRNIMRLLREGRALTANSVTALQDSPPVQLLASIGASISTLSSWDDGGSGSDSSRASSSSGYSGSADSDG